MYGELQGGILSVRVGDQDYPEALSAVPDKPEVLYVKGRWPLPKDVLKIGVVGARQATPSGMDVAARLASDLTQQGVMVVSGLARGIDASAHWACLRQGGWTVAVLGHGLKYHYPKENAKLYDEIAKEGTLMTEFPYEAAPLPMNFPQRNRIISGLSRGVVVVEAGEHSGALITARCAAEQGRDVFAVPGSPFHWQNRGSNRLIKEGAKLVDSAQDILEEYGFKETATRRVSRELPRLSEQEQAVFQHLHAVPLSVDEMVELTGERVDRLAEVLLSLELKGLIMNISGQRYVTRY